MPTSFCTSVPTPVAPSGISRRLVTSPPASLPPMSSRRASWIRSRISSYGGKVVSITQHYSTTNRRARTSAKDETIRLPLLPQAARRPARLRTPRLPSVRRRLALGGPRRGNVGADGGGPRLTEERAVNQEIVVRIHDPV